MLIKVHHKKHESSDALYHFSVLNINLSHIKLSSRKEGVKINLDYDVKHGSFAKVLILKAGAICILSPGLNLGFAMLNNFNAKRKKLSEKGNALV